ncbi:WD40 repeat-like protein [Ceratobasidium sp. AG-I]|nr:WD40 repeat-like protein [Ceratobasidium sp. AG-I]
MERTPSPSPKDSLTLLATWSTYDMKDIKSGVKAVAISNDNIRVAFGLTDYDIYIWDVQLGTLVTGPLRGHTQRINSLAFSPDGTYLVSGSLDQNVFLWDTRRGTASAGPLESHIGSITSVSFSPDHVQFASGSTDHNICVWDVHTRTNLYGWLQGHVDEVTCVAFSPNGNYIVSGSRDLTIRIWDAYSGSQVFGPFRGHTAMVFSVGFSPDSTQVVSGSRDESVRVWDVQTGLMVLGPLEEAGSSVTSVTFSPNGSRIFAHSYVADTCAWNARDGTLLALSLKASTHNLEAMAFSSDCTRYVVVSNVFNIQVWEIDGEELDLDASENVRGAESYVSVSARTSANVVAKSDISRESISDESSILAADISERLQISTGTLSGSMSAHEMFFSLLEHGCSDLSSYIDPDEYSSAPIAGGGFGDIWAGKMQGGMKVAIKCLRLHAVSADSRQSMKRAARELYVWSKAKHPNVQELSGVIMFQGHLGMVSPWMENGNLQYYLQKSPDVDRYQLCIQISKGVSYLHSIGMVHGDIKVPNILVSSEGVAKLSDFDHSILMDSTLGFSSTTNVGGGTLRWMVSILLGNYFP